MRIIAIELAGYRRFALTQYDVFKYTPEHKIQLILGTNGCGKSSLMRELSPLPAVSADFKPGGYKIVTIEQGGRQYRLTSAFGSGAKHSFVVDGEELNSGGTAQVQKELVASHFNITPDVHDIMVGLTAFSTMSVATRREWFTRLSNINFNFALALYQDLRTKLRDADGALKFQQSLLVTESAKLLDEIAVEALKKEVTETKTFIDQLLELKAAYNNTAPLTTQQVNEQLSVDLYGLKTALRSLEYTHHIPSPIKLPELISRTEHQIAIEQDRYKQTIERLEELQSLIGNVEKVSTTELENLDQQISSLRQQIHHLTERLVYLNVQEDPVTIGAAIELAYDSLYDALKDLPANTERLFSKARYEELKEQLSVDRRVLVIEETKHAQLSGVITRLAHLKSHNQINCPECRHAWVPGYDDKQYHAGEQQLAVVVTGINEVKKRIEAAETKAAAIEEYFTRYRIYVKTRDQMPILAAVWRHIDTGEIVIHNPAEVIAVLEKAKYDVPVLLEMKKHNEHLKDLEKLVTLRSSNQVLDIQKLKSQSQLLDEQLIASQYNIRQQRAQLQIYQTFTTFYDIVQKYATALEKALGQHQQSYHGELNSLRQSIYADLIRHAQLSLNEKQQQLSITNSQAAVVENIRKNIEQLSVRQHALTAMVAELSPKDGLIAKSLSGFINSFVEKINRIIRQIWLYPFELLPLDLSDDGVDLDYRFEVHVNHQTVIPDIGKCSSGMREVIDLAFRIVSMSYLGLDHSPIYMDEFGKSMDSTHRAKAFDTISKMIAQSNYSQIFMVSHHEHSYGSLKNADIVVINADNVVVPAGSAVNKVITVS